MIKLRKYVVTTLLLGLREEEEDGIIYRSGGILEILSVGLI